MTRQIAANALLEPGSDLAAVAQLVVACPAAS